MESTIDPVVLNTAALNHEQKCEMCISLIKVLYTPYIFNFLILAVLDKIVDQIIIHFHTLMIWHDDVIKWKHFPRYRPFVRAIHQWPVNSPHKGQWRGALMFSLICDRINGWVNNREAGDLRRHPARYDVIVMDWLDSITQDVCIFEYVNKTTPVYVSLLSYDISLRRGFGNSRLAQNLRDFPCTCFLQWQPSNQYVLTISMGECKKDVTPVR